MKFMIFIFKDDEDETNDETFEISWATTVQISSEPQQVLLVQNKQQKRYKRFYCYFSILLGRVYPFIRECIVLQENLTMTSTDNVTPAEHHGTSKYLCDYILWFYFIVPIGLIMLYIPVSCVHPWMTWGTQTPHVGVRQSHAIGFCRYLRTSP